MLPKIRSSQLHLPSGRGAPPEGESNLTAASLQRQAGASPNRLPEFKEAEGDWHGDSGRAGGSSLHIQGA